jgi:hypothetical protein
MAELRDVAGLAQVDPAVIFKVPKQFMDTHTSLDMWSCKLNTVENTPNRPDTGPRPRKARDRALS